MLPSEKNPVFRAFLLLSLLTLLFLFGCHADSPPPPTPVIPVLPARVVTIPSGQFSHFVRATSSGLNYRWKIEGKRPLDLLQTIGNGCAFLDVNRDGNLDILLVGGRIALCQGDGKGHFTDVSAKMGLAKLKGHFLGCCVGDFNNDGYDDLYLSGHGTGALLLNKAGKQFQDVTLSSQIPAQSWGTSCQFVDLDDDGWLDLIVCGYIEFGPKSNPRLCPQNGVPANCNPHYYPRLKASVYHNSGGKTFGDVTKAWGLDNQNGYALGVSSADYEGNGKLGIAIANDGADGDLFQKTAKDRYVNVNQIAGVAVDRKGHKHAGMGIDWGDYNNDGKLDLFVTTFRNQIKTLYINGGNGIFTEQSDQIGLDAATQSNLAFGCKFFDANNDGWLDLMIANGHVQDNIAQIEPGAVYRQPAQFLQNSGGTVPAFAEAAKASGMDRLPALVGRGLAVGDYDNDGRVDALIVDSEGEPILLHNETKKSGNWIGFDVRRKTGGNRSGIGAKITLTTGGRTLIRYCLPGGSYLSSSDPRVHFGIGTAAKVDSVVLQYPEGTRQKINAPGINRYLSVGR